MQTSSWYNPENESSADLVTARLSDYDSPAVFYGAAVREVFAGTESDAFIDRFTREASWIAIDKTQLAQALNHCFLDTPPSETLPGCENVSSALCLKKEWNDRRYLWTTPEHYFLLLWGSAF